MKKRSRHFTTLTGIKVQTHFFNANLMVMMIALCLSTFSARAQDKNELPVDSGSPMDQWLNYSRPGKYHQLLADLVGTWDIKGRHYSGNPNPDQNKVEIEFFATAVRKPFANGRFFIVESTSKEGQIIQSPIQDGKFVDDNARNIDTEGYDNVKKKFVHTMIGNHLGSNIFYLEGDYDPATKTIHSEFEYEPAPGTKWKVHYDFIIQDKDHYKIEIYGERGGVLIKDTEMFYTRVKL